MEKSNLHQSQQNLLILQISKFHASLHKEKKMKLSRLEYYSLCGKVNFSVIHPTILPFTVFEEQCLAQRFCKLLGKVIFNCKK